MTFVLTTRGYVNINHVARFTPTIKTEWSRDRTRSRQFTIDILYGADGEELGRTYNCESIYNVPMHFVQADGWELLFYHDETFTVHPIMFFTVTAYGYVRPVCGMDTDHTDHIDLSYTGLRKIGDKWIYSDDQWFDQLDNWLVAMAERKERFKK